MKPDDPISKLPVPVIDAGDPETSLERLHHYLLLSFSLPERLARALASLIGGTTLLLSKTLLPAAVKSSDSYRFTLGMFQTFLIKNVAQIDHLETDTELQEHFLNRKLLGTSLEAVGLLTMHLSPVWVFAIASDAAKGGQVFLSRLVHHLKENGVIAEESNPVSIEQVLLSIHDMSRQGATAIDTPPLSLSEVEELAAQLRESMAALRQNYSSLLPSFEALWSQIGRVASRENLSTEQVLGMLSLHAAAIAQTSRGTAGAVGKTGFYFLDEVILNDYKETLNGISATGSLSYMQQHMQPFVENAQGHFNFKIETRSQAWLKDSLARLLRKIRPQR